MIKRIIAQFIFNRYLNSRPESFLGKVYKKIFYITRNALIRFIDPAIKYKFAGTDISLPFSHNLPVHKKVFPSYDENIGRLASLIKEKYNDLKMIDIGANVGDTAVMIKSKADIPILCIEGEEKFISLLHTNTKNFQNILIEESFVGDEKFIKGNYTYSKGSGRIVESESQSGIYLKTLQQILSNHPEFLKSKLLKIDTDGFDCRIIKNEIGLLTEMKPVIFFEYDPYLHNKAKEDGLSVFDLLLKAGYNKGVFYINTGDYLLTTELNNKNLLADLHYYFSGRRTELYCDIAVFHNEDNDLANKLREKEIQYFSHIRNYDIVK
jgi:FkbM family methyltransferase